jgi:galactose mutarotase-like enzyme
VTSLRVAGRELLVQVPPGTDPVLGGCYPMVPWAGRVRGGRMTHDGTAVQLPLTDPPNALHGLGYRTAWSLLHAAPSVVAMRLDLSAIPDGGWPFGGIVDQLVRCEVDGITTTMSVRASRWSMPLTVGWHPWMVRHLEGVEGEIQLDAGEMYRRGADGLPTGALVPVTPPPWDDCMTGLAGTPSVVWPGVGRLTVESDLTHVVVFDGNPAGLCVEPQSGPPDEANLPHPRVLPAGGRFRARMRLRWRSA